MLSFDSVAIAERLRILKQNSTENADFEKASHGTECQAKINYNSFSLAPPRRWEELLISWYRMATTAYHSSFSAISYSILQ